MISDESTRPPMEIILMVGIPGSGKSTLAGKLFSSHVHVSLDAIKKWSYARQKKTLEMYSGSHSGAFSKGRKIEHVLMTEALEGGKNIVVDDTNLTRAIRRRHVELGRKHGATINVVFFQDIPRAYEQNRSRADDALEDWILDVKHKELEPPCQDEGFGYVRIME